MPAFLPEQTHVAQVRLRCRDAASLSDFYHDVLGLRRQEGESGEVRLGGRDQPPVIVLEESKSAAVPTGPEAGLFHLALRYPTRGALGRAYLHLAKTRYPLEGASDHLVSEAIYLADPEGNGVELYDDRPRSAWVWRNDQVMMATKPLDLEELVLETRAQHGARTAWAYPDLGHIHLRVRDLKSAERFYHEFLGLAVTTRGYPGALFFAAGGYHHHIGINTWGSPEAASPNSTGLISYTLKVPMKEILYCLKNRAPLFGVEVGSDLKGANGEVLRLRDPNGQWLEVSVA